MAKGLRFRALAPLAAAVGISLVANLALLSAALHLVGRTFHGILALLTGDRSG